MRILAARGVVPHEQLLLFLVSSGDHAIAWLQSDLVQFFEHFSGELPSALERILGNQVHDVKPRWAKGTAHRVARFPIISMSLSAKMRRLAMPLLVSKEAIVNEEVEKAATETRRVTRLVRLPEAQYRVGLGRSTTYRWRAEGQVSEASVVGRLLGCVV